MADVVVSRRAVDSIRRGHPWIYRSAVVQVSSDRKAGSSPDRHEAIVNIADESGQRLGWGVWDPISPIAVRVWSLDPQAQHIDLRSRLSETLGHRIESAIEVRRALFERQDTTATTATTAYRLLNGEGDRVPGFVIDRYADVAVLRVDGDAAGALVSDLLPTIEAHLRAIGITTLLERTGRRGEAPAVRALFGPMREKVEVKEHGVRFVVDLKRGQKTGAFLDQRENRRRIGELVDRRKRTSRDPSKPVRVLNLFSYTGGFSLRAAIAGATVTSVDVAAAAHATAQESFRLAGVDPRGHVFATADCFQWLENAKKRGEKWDVVISDPPSFAPSEKAKPKGMSAYRSLHRACADVLADGGTFVAASCSSHVTAEEFASTLDDLALGRSDLRLLEMFGPPADHPTLAAFPEGRYLKLHILE